MLYIQACTLKVGDVFYQRNLLDKRAPFVVVGVGEASNTYKHGFLWRKTGTYKTIEVMTEEIICGWDPARYWNNPVTLEGHSFSFAPNHGIWIENRKATT